MTDMLHLSPYPSIHPSTHPSITSPFFRPLCSLSFKLFLSLFSPSAYAYLCALLSVFMPLSVSVPKCLLCLPLHISSSLCGWLSLVPSDSVSVSFWMYLGLHVSLHVSLCLCVSWSICVNVSPFLYTCFSLYTCIASISFLLCVSCLCVSLFECLLYACVPLSVFLFSSSLTVYLPLHRVSYAGISPSSWVSVCVSVATWLSLPVCLGMCGRVFLLESVSPSRACLLSVPFPASIFLLEILSNSWTLCVFLCLSLCVYFPFFLSVSLPLCVSFSMCLSLYLFCSMWVSLCVPPPVCVCVCVCVCERVRARVGLYLSASA